MGSTFLTDAVVFEDGVTIDSNGILRGVAKIARIGVQEYMIDGLPKKVLRPVDEVMRSADTFSYQVTTLNHPADGVMVNSANAKDLQVGLSGEVTYDDGWLSTLITVTVDEAVSAARTTHKQFSNGYFAELAEESGIWKDELGVQGTVGEEYTYDLVQRNIKGNHTALVTVARAGDNATFLDDATYDSKCFTIIKDEQSSVNYMATIQITDHQGVTLTLDDNSSNQRIVGYINSLMDGIATRDSTISDSQATVDTQATEIDTLKATNDALTVTNDDLKATIETLKANGMDLDFSETTVTERTTLWCYYNDAKCDPVLVDYALAPVDIKRSILSQTIDGFDTKFKDATDAEIEVAWKMKDSLAPVVTDSTDKTDVINDGIRDRVIDSARHEQGTNPNETPVIDARQEFIESRTKQTVQM